MQKTLVVAGGGAAGFFCAINAARLNPSLRVIIAEKSNKLLSKVKISGGGRCNVTHACFEIPGLVKHYPRGQNFLKKSFHWFNTKDTITWFAERNVILKTEPDGRMFPISDDSASIINCLVQEANKYRVEILFNTEIKVINATMDGFLLEAGERRLEASFFCIACGGYPKAAQFSWLLQTGHTIEPPVPSLFTFNIPGNTITTLMGISVPGAAVKIQGTKFSETGPVLITHWGLSGPAILKLSARAARELAQQQYRFTILVNWVPGYNENSLRTYWQHLREQLSTQKTGAKNPFGLPARLWLYFLAACGADPETKWGALEAHVQNRLIKMLTTHEFRINGKTTFKEEFVTCGGIRLNEIDPNTMQSKIKPGLFFSGEIMDVDGVTGGFNFQHAWTSGWIAARHIASLQEKTG